MNSSKQDVLISVIIVNYKVPECLREALRSLNESTLQERAEVIVVDNASNDNSREIIIGEFPEVQWIQLKSNIGFGKACNVAAQQAIGKFLLILNPDTVLSHNTLIDSVEFMQANPDVGLMGPKILNPDGSLQPSCRRSFPTPMVALYHFSGLSKLFPKSKRFGRYNLTYINENESAQVDAISGSFMFIKRELFEQISGFDEQFFMYGEDLDLCWRIREKGYKVWYYPKIQIIHLKGKSSAKSQLRSRIAFYDAMVIFSRKYRHIHGSFFPGWLIFFGIWIEAVFSITANFLKTSTALLIDLVIINCGLAIGISVRFHMLDALIPYFSGQVGVMIGLHALLSFAFLFMFAYNGIYSRKRYSVVNALFSGLFASILFYSAVYFLKSIAYSRLAFAISSIAISFLLVGYRELIPRITQRVKRLFFSPDNVIIVGTGAIASLLIKNIEEQRTSVIAGVLWSGSTHPGEFEGYPVLGTVNDIRPALERHNIDMLLIATETPWYSLVIEALGASKVKNLTIRWVPHDLFALDSENLPSVIPLRDFSVDKKSTLLK